MLGVFSLMFILKTEKYTFSVDGVWGPWSGWNACPVSCGQAATNRSRVCIFEDPNNQGNHCDYDGSTGSESQICGVTPCPCKMLMNV